MHIYVTMTLLPDGRPKPLKCSMRLDQIESVTERLEGGCVVRYINSDHPDEEVDMTLRQWEKVLGDCK